jgi:fido (protein-threonine AMPylation protein)
MPNWDEDSPQLRHNLIRLFRRIRDEARRRDRPSLDTARSWHREFLAGLVVPNINAVGRFRGEPGLEDVEVQIGPRRGMASDAVASTLSSFESTLQTAVARLDALLPVESAPDADKMAAIIDLCAWTHSEWVRIHPFLNGNGRTARLWANSIAMRYGLPPFVTLRPRPGGGYEAAAESAMQGKWQPTAVVFRQMLAAALWRPAP